MVIFRGAEEKRIESSLAENGNVRRRTCHGGGGPRPDSSARFAPIDALRALAVAAVVAFHTFPSTVRGGYIGVDVFFVISGFVIAFRYLDDLKGGRTGFTEFYARRVRRLLPAYAVVVFATAVACLFIMYPRDLMNFGDSLLAQAVYIQNIIFWHQGEYFDNALTKPLLHTWSLAIEEQFYLLFPLLVLVMRRRQAWVPVFIAGLLVASFVSGWVIGRISAKTAFYWLPFRAWEFLVGIACARLHQRADRVLTQAGRAGIAVGTAAVCGGIGSILVAIFAFNEASGFPGLQAMLAALGTALVCLAQRSAYRHIQTVLAAPPIQHLGRISYSWYLWHWPPIALFFIGMQRTPRLAESLVLLCVGYALGWLSYSFIERRALDSRALRRARSAAGGVAAFAAMCIVIGLGIAASQGLMIRYPAAERSILTAQMDIPSYRCSLWRRLSAWSEEFCQLNDVKGVGGFIIIGDSHADMLKDEIARLGQAKGVPVYMLKQNCQLSSFGLWPNCPERSWSATVEQMRRRGIGSIIAIAFWKDPSSLAAAARRASAAGLKLSLMLSTPSSPMQDPATLIRTPTARVDTSAEVYRTYSGLIGRERAALDGVAQADLRILDPSPILCPGERCLTMSERSPIFSDAHHLNGGGVRLLSPLLATLFEPAEASEAHRWDPGDP